MKLKHGLGGLAAVALLAGGSVVLCAGSLFGVPCVSTGVRYGAWLDTCPAGSPLLDVQVDASGLLRGEAGTLMVTPTAVYMDGEQTRARPQRTALHRGYTATVELLDADEEPVAGLALGDWERGYGRRSVPLTLPDVGDGDYLLRVTVDAGFDQRSVDVPLALYRPAIAFLQTDRPLYQPGQDVLLRSVVLARTDLSPLDDRPGQWEIRSPTGEQLLLEDDRAGSFGVADSSFPLGVHAPQGTWTALYRSGEAVDEVTFDVRPFKLPRLTVASSATERWFRIGDEVVVEGTATYTSGAPVADAAVQVRLSALAGDWPMPLDWEDAQTATTDAQGHYRVVFGEVPADVQGHNRFTALTTVTEAAGEVSAASTVVRVSEDELVVEALTELGNGLVAGFNNRAWLRVTTPDGVPVADTDVTVSNPWRRDEDPRVAHTDVDGVLTIQLDPGDPVTVVDPARVVRQRPVEVEMPRLSSATRTTGGALGMDERRAIDAVMPAVQRCGDLTVGGEVTKTGLRVDPAGRVTDVLSLGTPLAECVADALRGARFPVGAMRTYELNVIVPDSGRPQLGYQVSSIFAAPEVDQAVEAAAVEARRCVGSSARHGERVLNAEWSVDEDATRFRLDSVDTLAASGLSSSELACVVDVLRRAELPRKAGRGSMGSLWLTLQVPQHQIERAPRPTTRTAYELRVAAQVDGEAGETRLVLPVGHVPNVRLRATPAIARPGGEVEVELLRGPGYTGGLPDELRLMAGSLELAEAELDEDTRTARFTLPDDARGFATVDFAGARTVVFIDEEDPLSVELSSDKTAYRPGERATLTVTTQAGGQGVPAAVGLVGVDASLAQLAPLLGEDAMSRVTVRAESAQPAFDSFGAAALAMGQIRGENAATAALMTVSSLPNDPAGDTYLSASATVHAPHEETLIDHFYRAQEATLKRLGDWEDSAPEGEMMSPALMARLYGEALDDLARAGEPAVDAFGRPLVLAIVPPDLAAQLDPRSLVSDTTRLPEDVVDWSAWLRTEVY